MVPVASTPSISTRPLVGSSNPAMMLKMVLLPQPDGPIRLTKRPCGIDSVTGASAWKASVGVLNIMLTSATQSFGAEDDMRTPLDRVVHGFPPSPGHYIAKAVPAAIAVCVYPRALIEAQRPAADDGKLRPVHKLSAAFSRMPRGIRDITSPPHYLASTFAALRMGDQRAISAFTKLSNFAGVRSSLAGSDPPRSATRVLPSV